MTAKRSSQKEIVEMLSHIVTHMATKDDIKDMATKDDIKKAVSESEKRIMERLGAFENHEVDKRKQLEVRVSSVRLKFAGQQKSPMILG